MRNVRNLKNPGDQDKRGNEVMTNSAMECCPGCADGWPLRERLGKLVHIVDDSEYPRAIECTAGHTSASVAPKENPMIDKYPGAAELINGKDGMDPLDSRLIEQDIEAVKPAESPAPLKGDAE